MSQSVTKCAIKRTAIKMGAYAFGAIIGVALLIAIMSGIAALITMIVFAFPIMRHTFPFVLLTGIITIFISPIIYGVYREYKANRRICEALGEIYGAGHDHDKK